MDSGRPEKGVFQQNAEDVDLDKLLSTWATSNLSVILVSYSEAQYLVATLTCLWFILVSQIIVDGHCYKQSSAVHWSTAAETQACLTRKQHALRTVVFVFYCVFASVA